MLAMVTAVLATSFPEPKDLVHAALSSRGWDIVSKTRGVVTEWHTEKVDLSHGLTYWCKHQSGPQVWLMKPVLS